jgi:hypothetical protein
VRCGATTAALHPNAGSNGATRERLSKPYTDRHADSDANSHADADADYSLSL